MRTPQQTHHRQRGFSLIEALIALLVLSLGVLAMSKLQSHLRLNADVARQRSEAVRLAQEDLEAMRSFASLSAAKDTQSYADIAASSSTLAPGAARNTSYHIDRAIGEGNGYRTVSLAVDWPDRAGRTQRIALQSVVAATPPGLSGALALRGNAKPARALLGRSPLIPVRARDLGNGSSVFKPSETGTTAFVFDNASGVVTSRCEQVSAAIGTSDLATASLVDCIPMNGMLLSGGVRVSLSTPPDAANPTDSALLLDVSVTLAGSTGAAAPICLTAPGERVVAYHCVITPTLGRWSGRSVIVPRGWTIGTSSADRKVCRYSADQDGSGAVDSNAEHPNEYKDVDRSLMQQNFLVVRGDQSCPVSAKGAAVFADLSTVQHQP